jgi:putative transposase
VSRYRFVEAHREQYPIREMCHVLSVSRSGYYAWRKRSPSARERENGRLLAALVKLHTASGGAYGSPRLHQGLVKQGWQCGRHRVARLMRLRGIRGVTLRRKQRTTHAAEEDAQLPDLLQRDFTATQPNQKWVADMTYLATHEGWLYLAVVMDLYSRTIVGWAMQPRMTADLVCEALRMGLKNRQPASGLIHHSDRGSQYTSAVFQELLAAHEIRPSVGSTGDCYDNAAMESFFATLKRERIQHHIYATRAEARTAVFQYIEVFYNRQRLHSTLGYCSPLEYELQYHSYLSVQ